MGGEEVSPPLPKTGGGRWPPRNLEVSFRGGGRPRGSALAVADRSHAFVRVAVRSLTVPRGAPRLDAWRRRRSERVNQKEVGTRSGQARTAQAGGWRASARGGHPAWAARPPARPEARSSDSRGDAPGRLKPPGLGRGLGRRRPGAGERSPVGATPHGQLGPRAGLRHAPPRRGETRPGIRSRLDRAEAACLPTKREGARREAGPWGARARVGARTLARTYLVDPASSHMLVSKAKPCPCNHRPPHGEAADGSLDRLQFIRSYTVTWITVVILELIHATSLLDQNQPAREGRARW